MSAPRNDDTPTWVGRAPARPPADPWPTREQPIVPGYAPPPEPPSVVFVEVPRRRRAGFIVGLMLVCFAAGITLAFVASPALRDKIGMGVEPPAPEPSPTQSPTPPPPPPPPGIGDPVQDGTFEFVVANVECGVSTVGTGIFTTRAGGQYCLVDISVRNTGSIPALFLDSAQWADSSDGTRHNSDTRAGIVANGGLQVWINLVQPGQTLTGTIVFDIPAEVDLASVELHDSPLSNGVTVTIEPTASPT